MTVSTLFAASSLLAVVSGCATSKTCTPDFATLAARECLAPPCAPPPPREGPGAPATKHRDVVVRDHDGQGAAKAFVTYEPASPRPASAPVVLFLHGFFDETPTKVDALLQQVARSGFIVVYPTYGVPWLPGDWESNAAEAFAAALRELDGLGHVHPDRERVSYVGHSIGGILALRLANRAHSPSELPAPRTVVLLDAAGLATPAYPAMPVDDLSKIPVSTWLLVVMAEESYALGKGEASQCRSAESAKDSACNALGIARRAFAGTPQIPGDHKSAVVIPSDRRGGTVLRSEHNGALGHCGSPPKPIDAIDTYGYWKLTVGALAATCRSTWSEYAFRDTEQRRSMGHWSDGAPVKPILGIDACLEGSPCR
jgi:acetyl esterase/lipase